MYTQPLRLFMSMRTKLPTDSCLKMLWQAFFPDWIPILPISIKKLMKI